MSYKKRQESDYDAKTTEQLKLKFTPFDYASKGFSLDEIRSDPLSIDPDKVLFPVSIITYSEIEDKAYKRVLTCNATLIPIVSHENTGQAVDSAYQKFWLTMADEIAGNALEMFRKIDASSVDGLDTAIKIFVRDVTVWTSHDGPQTRAASEQMNKKDVTPIQVLFHLADRNSKPCDMFLRLRWANMTVLNLPEGDRSEGSFAEQLLSVWEHHHETNLLGTVLSSGRTTFSTL